MKVEIWITLVDVEDEGEGTNGLLNAIYEKVTNVAIEFGNLEDATVEERE